MARRCASSRPGGLPAVRRVPVLAPVEAVPGRRVALPVEPALRPAPARPPREVKRLRQHPPHPVPGKEATHATA